MRAIDDDTKKSVASLLGVKSTYFKAQIEIVLNKRKRQLTSYFIRNNQDININYRSLAPFETRVPSKLLE